VRPREICRSTRKTSSTASNAADLVTHREITSSSDRAIKFLGPHGFVEPPSKTAWVGSHAFGNSSIWGFVMSGGEILVYMTIFSLMVIGVALIMDAKSA
jgi:hypothetical protein